MMIMRCRVCNAYVPEGATYCLDCGTNLELEPEVVCQRCGNSTSPDARFCRKCGAEMTKPTETRPAVAVTDRNRAGGDREAGGVCRRCGGSIPEGVVYCPSCGTSRESPTYPQAPPGGASKRSLEVNPIAVADPTEPTEGVEACPRCGSAARGTGRFCHNCGRFLGTDIEDVICADCGATSPLRYPRCQYCGADLPSKSHTEK
jgi:ribosomal protein L40E